MATTPVFLSPLLPTEFLTLIINQASYPTTLIICSSRADFVNALQDSLDGQDLGETNPAKQLLSTPLHQIAVTRHIRIVFTTTVSHLRAFLATFRGQDSKIPPLSFDSSLQTGRQRAPLLLVYGLLDLHRNTSEWTARGLSNTTAAFVEQAHRHGFQAVVIEPRRDDQDLESLLDQRLPILGAVSHRPGRDVRVHDVLCRWFKFEECL
jgi:hypothetical protein